jgi:glucose-6-phosphate 1-dehydrogenase
LVSCGARHLLGSRFCIPLLSKAHPHGGRCPRPSWPGGLSPIPAERAGAGLDRAVLDRLVGRCRFAEGDLEAEDGYHGLARRLRDEADLPNNRLFYLAVAPRHDGVIAERLAALGLTGEEVG